MAMITTLTPTITVYEEPSVTSTKLGTLNRGTYINISELRVVTSITWIRFTCDGFTNAWVIAKHPSVNYYYVNINMTAQEGSLMASLSNGTATVYRVGSSNDSTYSTESEVSYGGVVKTVDETITTRQHTASINLPRAFADGGTRGLEIPSTMPPQTIQNQKGYPLLKGFDATKNRYEYDYATDYSNTTLVSNLTKVRDSLNISFADPDTLFKWNSEKYNRFKVPNPNEILPKTFPHIFFTRPDCAVLNYKGSGTTSLHQNVSGSPLYNLRFNNSKELLYSLVINCGWNHDFMLYLSNRITGFELRDRTLETDTYGKTLRGNSVAYGRTTEKSTAAGELSLTFQEDIGLHTLHLHELWIDYIDGVNKGRYTPDNFYIMNKTLDYATAAYYILCGPDGETILYIAKYYGIFPTSVPDSVLSWQRGNIVTNPEISISYQYSWFEADKPQLILDFNSHINSSDYIYERAYQPDILSTGTTWVGPPFIETSSVAGKTVYKLRYCHL